MHRSIIDWVVRTVIYLIMITILGVMTTAVALLKHFRTPAYRWMRTTLFLALGLFGIVPTVHGILLYGVCCCCCCLCVH